MSVIVRETAPEGRNTGGGNGKVRIFIKGSDETVVPRLWPGQVCSIRMVPMPGFPHRGSTLHAWCSVCGRGGGEGERWEGWGERGGEVSK